MVDAVHGPQGRDDPGLHETGEAIPVTVLEVGPNYVTQIKTPEQDGYAAVQLGLLETQKLNRPEKGHLRWRMFPAFDTSHEVPGDGDSRVGRATGADIFAKGEKVDMTVGAVRRDDGHQGQGLRGRGEAPRLRRRPQDPRPIRSAPCTRLHRRQLDPRSCLQRHAHGGPDGNARSTVLNLDGCGYVLAGAKPVCWSRVGCRARRTALSSSAALRGSGRRQDARIAVRNSAGEEVETITLSDDVFGGNANVPLMHQAVVRIQATAAGDAEGQDQRRSLGGGREAVAPEGDGQRPAGIAELSHCGEGGGVVPPGRAATARMPKKMRRQATRSALSSRIPDQGNYRGHPRSSPTSHDQRAWSRRWKLECAGHGAPGRSADRAETARAARNIPTASK